ncbi:MAG: sulfotransferase [Hyphomicrobiales bacterium]
MALLSQKVSADAVAQRARAADAANRADEAIRLFREAVAAAPKRADLLLELGVTEAKAGRNADSARHLEKALKLAPLNADVHFNLGQLARLENQCEKAIRLYRRTVELDPTYVNAVYGLGEALFVLGRHAEAEPWLRKAVAAMPRDSEALNVLAMALVEQKQVREAIQLYQRSLALAPASNTKLALALALEAAGAADDGIPLINEVEAKGEIPDGLRSRLAALFYAAKDFRRARQYAEAASAANAGRDERASHVLAKLTMDAGDFDAAEAMLRKSLEQHGPHSHPWYMLSQMNRLEPEAERAIRRFAGDESRSAEERSTAYFTLYAITRKSLSDEESFALLDKANTLAREAHPFDLAYEQRLVDGSISTFTRDFLARRAGEGDAGAGPVFVVGMPRSGTTLTEQILAAHPDVWPGDERGDILDLRREVPNYPYGAAEVSPQWAKAAGQKIRRAMFAEAAGRRYATDKLPGNYMNLGLISWILPDAKLIYVKRDPHDNALSLYEQNFGANLPYATDLEACGHMYREHLRIMRHWQDVGLSIHTVDYDALVADPEPHIRAMLAFLGLGWHEGCLTPQDVKRGVATASVWQVRQPISKGSVGKWKRFERQLRPFTRALEGQ